MKDIGYKLRMALIITFFAIAIGYPLHMIFHQADDTVASDCKVYPTHILPKDGEVLSIHELLPCEGGWATNQAIRGFDKAYHELMTDPDADVLNRSLTYDFSKEVRIEGAEGSSETIFGETSVLIWKDIDGEYRWRGSDRIADAVRFEYLKALIGGVEDAFGNPNIRLIQPEFDDHNVRHFRTVGELRRGEGGFAQLNSAEDVERGFPFSLHNDVTFFPYRGYELVIWKDFDGNIRWRTIPEDEIDRYMRHSNDQ